MIHPKESKFLQFDCNKDNLQYFHLITGVVSISLCAVFKAIGICHASYVDCLMTKWE